MLRNEDGHHRRRTRLTVLLAGVIALSGIAASPAAAGPLAAPGPLGAPVFATAAAKAVPLSKAGVSASAAALDGRTLTVTVRARRATSVTFAVVSGAKILTSVRGRAAKGTKTLKLTLPGAPSGTGLRLRVSARAGKRTARSTITLKVATPTTPSSPTTTTPTPTPPPPPTTTTTTTTPSDPAPPPPPPATPRVTLSAATVAENEPSGTAVGTLATAEAPAVGAAPQFTLVTGTGDADNASFAVDGTTLRTAASFNFEARSQYAIRVRATDGGSVETALTVTVTNVNETPVAGATLTIAGSAAAFGNTPLVISSGRSAPTNTGGPQHGAQGDLLGGASDPDGDPLSTVAETKATTFGAAVTIEADGDFVYRPKVGCGSGMDTLTATITDGHGGTVDRTIEVVLRPRSSSACVWYVDPAAAPGGTGAAWAPFNSLAALNTSATDPDEPADVIYLAAGTHSGPFTLEASQQIFTARSGLSPSFQELAAPNAGATVTLGNGTLTAADGSRVQGLDLGSTSGAPALAGTLTTSFTMNTGAINNTQGAAVDLSGGTLDVNLTSVSSSGASGGSPNAVRLNGTSGTFSAPAGTLQSAAGTTVVLTGASGSGKVNFTYGGTVVDSSGQLIDINNQSAGTKDFNGLLYSLGTDGVALTANTGATIRFDGGMTLQRVSAGTLFSASGGGTLAITDPAGTPTNDLYAASGTALSVTDTTIRADGLTFASLGGSSGTSAVVLSNTGAGGLTVLGTGSALAAAGSPGGLVTGMSGPGVSLTNVGGAVALTGMEIKNGLDDGVRADNVAFLTLTNPKLTTNGNAATDHAVDVTTGTGGAAFLTVTGAQVTGIATAVGRGVSGTATGTATLKALVQNSTFSGITPESIWLKTSGSLAAAPKIETEVLNNVIGTATARSGSISETAIAVSAVGRGIVRAKVAGNTLQQYVRGITLEQTNGATYTSGAKGRLDATLSGNTLSSPNTTDNPTADGVQVNAGTVGGDAGTLCLDLQANTLAAASVDPFADLSARVSEGSDLLLPSYGGGATDAAAVTTYLNARIGNGTAAAGYFGTTGTFKSGTCTLPVMD